MNPNISTKTKFEDWLCMPILFLLVFSVLTFSTQVVREKDRNFLDRTDRDIAVERLTITKKEVTDKARKQRSYSQAKFERVTGKIPVQNPRDFKHIYSPIKIKQIWNSKKINRFATTTNEQYHYEALTNRREYGSRKESLYHRKSTRFESSAHNKIFHAKKFFPFPSNKLTKTKISERKGIFYLKSDEKPVHNPLSLNEKITKINRKLTAPTQFPLLPEMKMFSLLSETKEFTFPRVLHTRQKSTSDSSTKHLQKNYRCE